MKLRHLAFLPGFFVLLSQLYMLPAQPAPGSTVSARVFADLLRIPAEAPQVSAVVRERREEGTLFLEDVVWDSIDEEEVPAWVIRPAGTAGRLPAVICLHGTGGSRDSMAAPEFGNGEWTSYQASRTHRRLLGWARELSRRGYVTLAMTQRGLDYRLPNTEARNKEMLVHGRNVMGTIVYEIRQAITYLRSRPDVDPDRIGITGMSFGGITSFYTWLVDHRLAAAAPICGGVGSVQTFLDIGSRGYHGIYWWVPDMLKWGDQGDFAAAMAPRPLMLWAPLDDIGMPKEGVDEFLRGALPAYEQAGARDKLVVHRPPGEHTFSLAAFEALVEFFDRELAR